MKRLLFFLTLCSLNSYGFVAGPGSLTDGQNSLGFKSVFERGTLEPHTDRASYQKADVKSYSLSFSRGVGDVWVFQNSTLKLDYTMFESKKEEVNGVLFYNADEGDSAGLTFSGDFVHTVDRVMTFFVTVNPYRNYNENKFSNPRVDRYSFGATSSFNITDTIFQKNLFAYGSGDGSSQNSYIALEHGYGYRLDSLLKRSSAVGVSAFLEADLKDRFDASYDAEFSNPGEQDRIRAMKYGMVLSLDTEITNNLNLEFDYLSKKGGYDARSTKVYSAGLSYRF